MKRTFIIALAACVLLLTGSAVLAADDCTYAAIKANVDKAVEIINAKGKAGLAEVAAMRYCDGKGYVYVQGAVRGDAGPRRAAPPGGP